MRRESPPPVKRGRTPNPKTEAKKNELLANAGVWFVWQEEAKYYEYGQKALRSLCGVRAGDKGGTKNAPYEVAVRRNDNGTYKVYARYNSKESQ